MNTRALEITSVVLLVAILGAIIALLTLEVTYTPPKGIKGDVGPVGNIQTAPKPNVITLPTTGLAFESASIRFNTQMSLTLASFSLFVIQTIPNNSTTLVCDWPFDSNDIVIGSCVNTSTFQTGSLFVNGGRVFLVNSGIWNLNDRISCQVCTS